MTMNLSGSFFPAYKAKSMSFWPETFARAERTVDKLFAARTTSEQPGMLLVKAKAGKTRTFNRDTSRPFDAPKSGQIAVKVINLLDDEVMKVFRV
jgi:hypothetical protein